VGDLRPSNPSEKKALTVTTVLEADYSSALTLLLRYPPLLPHGPQTIVHDGLYLEQNLSPARGAFIVAKYSGRPPELSKIPHTRFIPRRMEYPRRETSENSSPGRSPARVNLESLFQDVSEGLQRRAEAWGVAKAVRGAVSEARRSVTQTDGSINTSRSWNGSRLGSPNFRLAKTSAASDPIKRSESLEYRSKVLAGLLSETVNELLLVQERYQISNGTEIDGSLNRALAKIRYVQNCLEQPSLPASGGAKDPERNSTADQGTSPQTAEKGPSKPELEPSLAKNKATGNTTYTFPGRENSLALTKDGVPSGHDLDAQPVLLRPAADSEFSWMLGDGSHRSSFISSASLPPEQSRKAPLFGDSRETGRGKALSDDEGLAMSSLRGDDSR
jgi:TBC1 domain family member 5